MTPALLTRPRPAPAWRSAPPLAPGASASASTSTSTSASTQPPGTRLAGPFAGAPDPLGLRPTPATRALVRTQVEGLLQATPSYHQLGNADRGLLQDRLTSVAAYAAECLRDIYWQSERLGQTPVLKETRTSGALVHDADASAPLTPDARSSTPLAQAQANDFKPRAASQIGSVTQQTLRAIAFPTFVADLIRGTFDAILQTNIRQMEAFSQLLSNVSKTVDQFMADNVSDAQAHGWLAQRYPQHLQLQGGKAVPRDNASELPPPDFESELHVSAGLDESAIEDTLLPAARRRLAETRLQMLSTMVLMGINRIVITAGKIRATMGFHIDTSDSAFERTAQDVDARMAVRGHYNALLWGVEASASLAYVSSTRAGSDAEINTETDLTGEVELHFKSDYFPVERFATGNKLQAISNNTAVPEANPAPTLPKPGVGAPPGGDGAVFKSPHTQRKPREAPPAGTPVGSPLPAPRLPTAPIEKGTLDPKANDPVAPKEEPAEGDDKKTGEAKPGDKKVETKKPDANKPGGKAEAKPKADPKADPEPQPDPEPSAEGAAAFSKGPSWNAP